MGVGVLGPLQVDDGRVRLGSRDRVVLAALVSRAGEVATPDQLAEAVWGEEPPESWLKNLQGCISRLRKELGHDAIQTAPQGYRLVLGEDDVDAWHFRRLLGRARELLTLNEPERAHFVVTQALGLWRGSPLVELEEWPPGAREAEHLGELRLDAEELLVEAALAAGHHRDVLATASGLVEAAPLRERRWSLLALAQYRCGRQAEALNTLYRLRRLLSDELGLDPGPDAVALEQAILQQDPTLLVDVTERVGSSTCPYLGLRPYEESDAESYFGRDQEVARCLERLAAEGVLAVVGPSGSGKSSLVRAGVAAALRRRGEDVLLVTPGRHPMDAVAGLPGRRGRTVLVVDQAEELFSLCDEPEERRQFLDALVDHARARPLVVALRADRMGDTAEHPGLAELVERGLFLLGAMSTDNLRAAVEGPASQAGLVLEPGLVDLVVREVEGEPGALPLLSHTLRETWLRREGRTLTVSGYQAAGGVRGAVSQSAEQLYAAVPEDERGRLRELLLRLVAPGSDGEPVRARMPRRLVVADPVQERLVGLLVAARLVTSDDGVVEIAHESLARAWPRLRGWLEDDVEGRRVLHHLVAAADAWDTLGRPDSELYRGVRLSAALAWREVNHPELTAVERDFLAAGREAADAEARSAAERAHRQARLIRRLRLTLAGAAVLLVLTLVTGFLAVRQADLADAAADRASRAALAANARRVAARALVTAGPSEALLLAAAGARLDDSAETRGSLLGVLGKNPELVASMPMEGDQEVWQVAVHPDGDTVITYDLRHHLRLYDLSSARPLAEHQAGRAWSEWDWHGEVAMSSDGRTVAATTSPGSPRPVVLLDASTLEPLGNQPTGLRGGPWTALDLALDADGSRLAVLARHAQADGTAAAGRRPVVAVWDLRTPRSPSSVAVPATTTALDLHPGGQVVFTNAPLLRTELASGRSTRWGPHDVTGDGGVSVSPDGRLLALAQGSAGPGVAVLDARTGALRRRLVGDEGAKVWEPGFTPDSRRLVTVTWNDRVTSVWDVRTGRRVLRFEQDDGADAAFAISPDGSTLLSASTTEHSLRSWDLTGQRQLVQQLHEGRRLEAGFADVAPGGRRVAFSGGLPGGSAGERRWFLDLGTSRTLGPYDARGYTANGGSWSPDGEEYVSAVGGVLRVFDAAAGEVVRRRKPVGDEVIGVDHSTDGSRMAVAEADGAVTLLDSGTLAPVGRPVELPQGAGFVTLGPDNRTALVASGVRRLDPNVWLELPSSWSVVDLEEGTVLRSGELGFPALYADYSPDGRHAAVSGWNGQLLVLDVTTGQAVRPPVTAHQGGVFVFKYSPSGRQLLTSGTDGSVTLWDASRALPVAKVYTPGRAFDSAAFVDEHSVVISDWGGAAAWGWDTRLGPALELACRAAGRDLTEEEWRGHFGDLPYRRTCPV